jgi:hypothetical protein
MAPRRGDLPPGTPYQRSRTLADAMAILGYGDSDAGPQHALD